MNLEDLIKKISVLEDESRSNNKALSVLNTNFKKLEDSNASFLDTARELRKEVERLGGIISRLGQFDPALSQVRVDFAKKFNDVDAQQKKVELMISKARKENQDEIIKNQDSVKDLLNTWFEKEKHSLLETESRLNKKVLEIQNNYENDNKRDDSIRIAAMASVEVTERLSKKLESILGDIEIVKKAAGRGFSKIANHFR